MRKFKLRLSSRFHHTLTLQMALWFSVIALIPLGLTLYLNFTYASRILDTTMSIQLQAIGQRQSHSIKLFIDNVAQNTSLLAQMPTVVSALNDLPMHADPDLKDAFNQNLKALPTLLRLLEQLSLNNILLVSAKGNILYSVRDQNPQTLQGHPLSNVIDQTLMTLAPQVSDFILDPIKQHTALVFTAPVVANNQIIGVVAAQIHAQDIFRIASNYTGLGETGETLIGQKHLDHMQILNPTRHTIPNAAQGIDDTALEQAVLGLHNFGSAIDYRGQPVLAAWEYLPRLRWGLVVKKDISEILAPVTQLKRISLIIGSITLLIAIIAASLATQRITRPILSLSKVASRIAQGDLTAHYTALPPKNEIGVLVNAIAIMTGNLKTLITKVKDSSDHILSIYSATSQASKTHSEAALQTASSSLQISEIAKGMSETSQELIQTLEIIHNAIQKTALQAEFSRNRLRLIEATIHSITQAKEVIHSQFTLIQEKANAIHDIFSTITKIADRTNILALNTAIEAQQADSTGFRVIAREIKQLADQTCMTGMQIEKKIHEMDQAIQTGMLHMGQFTDKVTEKAKEISTTSTYINTLIEAVALLPKHLEQAFQRMQTQLRNSEQIDIAIRRMHRSVHSTASVINTTSSTLQNLQNNSRTFQDEIARFKL